MALGAELFLRARAAELGIPPQDSALGCSRCCWSLVWGDKSSNTAFPLPGVTWLGENPKSLVSSEMLLETNKQKKLNKSKLDCNIYSGEKAKLKQNWQTRSFLFIPIFYLF